MGEKSKYYWTLIDLNSNILEMPENLYMYLKTCPYELDTIKHSKLNEYEIQKQNESTVWKYLTLLTNERLPEVKKTLSVCAFLFDQEFK